MALCHFRQLRAFLFVGALFLLTVWGCGSVKSVSHDPQTQPVTVSVNPLSATVQTSKSLKFTAVVVNASNTGVVWQVNGVPGGDASHGTIDVSGVYTAPATVPTPPTVTITAIPQAASGVADTARVTVMPATPEIAVSVAPASAFVQTDKTQSITATVKNDAQNEGVTWTLSGAGCAAAACGRLSAASSASGAAITYTAPDTVPTPATVTLTATSVTDKTKTSGSTLTITLLPQPVIVTVDPTAASVQTGKTQSITATAQNDSQNKGVIWTLSGPGCSGAACGFLSATTSASGAAVTYSAPASLPSPATVTLTAKSVADTSKSAVVSITVITPPPVSVTVNPASASVQTGKTQSITAMVQNDSQNKGVTWTLTGSGCAGAICGTISASASASSAAITYTAPATAPSPATVIVTAHSVADSSKTVAATITVTLPPPVIVAVNPATAAVQTGHTQNVTATVQNDPQNKGVTWTLAGAGCSEATCGTLSAASSASGAVVTYTAPAAVPAPATVALTAQCVSDATKSVVVTIIISAAPPLTVVVNPTAASVQISQTRSVTATVQNDPQNKGVTWALSGAGCSGATCGTLSSTTSASGVAITYTAPAVAPAPASVTLTAQSVADATKTAITTITITSLPVTVSLSPKRAGLTTGQTQTFAATVTGSTTITVTWEVDTIPGGNSSVGTISASGVYSPPASPGTHTVGARSVADSTVGATASVAITDLAGVFTYHNDLARDGVNAKEYALNTSNVKTATFGKRFACAIDAAAYAQPLWVANVSIAGGTHNIVIAATQHDTVYAFDADASPCQTYWSKSLLGSGEIWVSSNDVGANDLAPDIGIVGTPVIDPATKTLYVVSKSKNGSTFHQRLHALSLTDGAEKFSGPKDIAFTSGGIDFNPLRENERCGLALVNGVVYIAYASHGDHTPYYGWVVGYNASTLALISVFNDDPTSGFGGIWMSGGAPAADSSNNLYMITGNGDFNGTTQFGDSFLKLSSGNIGVLSFFTPTNEGSLNSSDTDLGSGGAAVLVDQASSPVPRLLIGGGKEGKLYLLNRDALGGKNSNDSGAVQTFSVGNAIFATPAFWQNTLYLGPIDDHLKAYSFNTSTGTFVTSSSSQSPGTAGFPGSTPSISSLGSSNGIVWTIQMISGGASVLHAFDATNLATELWNSTGSGDQAGQSVKFTVPTVANGKVYVGTAAEISVYSLSPN